MTTFVELIARHRKELEVTGNESRPDKMGRLQAPLSVQHLKYIERARCGTRLHHPANSRECQA
jgi:hypothetical protein